MAGIKKLLFVDTNIWLDFYRARTEAGVSLLEHLEKISGKIIVTWQLEMEFKKNRLNAMVEGMKELKPTPAMARPGLFSNAKEIRAIHKGQKKAEERVRTLKARFVKALNSPARHDPVYQICQRIFHRTNDPLVLTRKMPVGRAIHNRALRRFLLGCPPRKISDTSIGDAFNWEWMIECAISQNAELVVVSRDSDYGNVFENIAYPNDHLAQEFRERVSRKRKLLLYRTLSEALEHFEVKVTETEKEEEEAIVQTAEPRTDAPSREFLSAEAMSRHFQRVLDLVNSPEWQARAKAIYEATQAARGVAATIDRPTPPATGSGT